MESLIEAITELVLKELEQARSGAPEAPSGLAVAQGSESRSVSESTASVLVVPGPEAVSEDLWSPLQAEGLRPVALAWPGFRPESLPAAARGWTAESRTLGWTKIVADYQGVVLLGSDLGVLGGLAQLGAGGGAPAALAVAAVAQGKPIFVESTGFEAIRRHSARLSAGFVRVFEQSWATALSFGLEMGQASDLARFLARLSRSPSGASAMPVRQSGRDVVTVEDVEVARRSGLTVLQVGFGAIVTPLARQCATEWGIEVRFQ